MNDSIKRYIHLSGEIERATKEREEVVEQIIAECAPFQKGDRITDGQQIAVCDLLIFSGLEDNGKPRFYASIRPFKPDGSPWKKHREVYPYELSDWHKTDAPATTEEKLKRWQP